MEEKEEEGGERGVKRKKKRRRRRRREREREGEGEDGWMDN